MLQRGLPAVLQWAPALSSACCHLQQTAAQQIACTSQHMSGSSSSYSSSNIEASAAQQKRPRFGVGWVDIRNQPRRPKLPYFNPEDGPEAYQYWKDLWENPKPLPKAKRRKTLPVYLEPEEQQALLDAAVGVGVPPELVQGDTMVRQVPRLIAAVQACGGRIPTDPDKLAARIKELLDLQLEVPGLDVLRIFKANGFGILACDPRDVKQQLALLSKQLSRAEVRAEAGLLMTAAAKPALKYPFGLIERAKQLPALFESSLDAPAPSSLLQHPFAASVLNKTSRTVKQSMRQLAQRHGKEAAASMYRRLPQLLLYRSHTLQRKTGVLTHSLGLTRKGANWLVQRNPRLLTFSADSMAGRLKGLVGLLGLEKREQLKDLVLAQPSLLYKSTENIAGKLSVICQQLDLPDSQQAAAVLLRYPYLACYSAAYLQQPQQQIEQLREESPLAPLKSKAREVLRAKPWLLTLGSSVSTDPQHSITGRLQLLDQLAELGPSWRDAVANWAASSSGDVAAVLAESEFVARVQWLLQQQPAAAAPVDGVGLYGLLLMRAARFERRYPGFLAQQQEQKEARGVAQSAAGQAAVE